jgi:formylglycine-generating enzyme required for sulfatase activity
VSIPTTDIKIGRVHSGFSNREDDAVPYYGWDNEFGHHSAKVQGFRVSEKLISNAEFFNFVLDQGYTREEFWSQEGWKWVSFTKSTYPKFWVNRSET